MIAPELKRYFQRDLKLFIIVFLGVCTAYFLILKFWRGGRIINKEEITVLPDISMMKIPGVDIREAKGGAGMPSIYQIKDPTFLFYPHPWTFSESQSKGTSLEIASVVRQDEFWSESFSGKTGGSESAIDKAPGLLVGEYLSYEVNLPHDKPPESDFLEGSGTRLIIRPDFILGSGLEKRQWHVRPQVDKPEYMENVTTPMAIKMGVSASGRIDFILLEKSSGSTEVDQEIIQALRRASFIPLDLPLAQEVIWGEVAVVWAVNDPQTQKEE